jgi:pyridoxine kinase
LEGIFITKYVLTIGGIDSLSGGGVVADVTTINSLNCFALTALTSVVIIEGDSITVQSLSATTLRQQLNSISATTQLDAVKVGFIPNSRQVRVVSQFLKQLKFDNPSIPIVLDPVFSFKEDANYSDTVSAKSYCNQLVKYATIMTPNRDEFNILQYLEVETRAKFKAPILSHNKSGEPDLNIIVKDVEPLSPIAKDILYNSEFEMQNSFELGRIEDKCVNGAGCIFSAALASHLAQGEPLTNAICQAKQYAYNAIVHATEFAARPRTWEYNQSEVEVKVLAEVGNA